MAEQTIIEGQVILDIPMIKSHYSEFTFLRHLLPSKVETHHRYVNFHRSNIHFSFRLNYIISFSTLIQFTSPGTPPCDPLNRIGFCNILRPINFTVCPNMVKSFILLEENWNKNLWQSHSVTVAFWKSSQWIQYRYDIDIYHTYTYLPTQRYDMSKSNVS